jgi:hypothetical protein
MIFFSRTTGPFFYQIWDKSSLGECIQVCSNERDFPFQEEIIEKEYKCSEFFLKSSRRPNSIKLGTRYPWVKEIQVQVKGQVLF